MDTITDASVEQLRKDLADAEQRHARLSGKAERELAARREAVEAGDAEKPSSAEVRALFDEADQAGQDVDNYRAALNSALGRRNGRDPEDQRPTDRTTARALATGYGVPVSIADAILESEAYKAARTDSQIKDAIVGASLMGEGEAGAEALAAFLRTGNLAAQFDGSGLVPPEYRTTMHGLDAGYTGAVLSWVRTGTTTSDSVTYFRQLSETVPVTGQPAGTAFQEATITYEPVTAPVRDRGVGIPVGVSNLADNGRLRSALDGRLLPALRRDAAGQVVSGDGTGQNMTGILNHTGVNTYTRDTTGGEPIANALHKGFTAIRTTALMEPTGTLLTPQDWESMLLEQSGSDGHYVNSAGPFGAIPMTLWGRRAGVEVTLAAGTSIVGKWDEAELIVREGPSVDEFRQHADYPIKRLVLLLAVYRATTEVDTPAAFTAVDTVGV